MGRFDMNTKPYGRHIQGGRLIKTSSGIMSIAPALGAAAVSVICAGSVSAQDSWPTVTDDTMTELVTSGGGYRGAWAVSADGSVIIGQWSDALGNHAASWVDGSTTATDLEDLGGDSNDAVAVSADGRVIVGYARVNDEFGNYLWSRAVSWVGGSTGPTDLGGPVPGSSGARAVSADGRVIVGYAPTTDNESHAASWVDGSTVPTDLGTLGGTRSYANAVSADGNVIVGQSNIAGGGRHAASWVNGSTTAIDLGTLGGILSEAYAVSADGSVIVGNARTADDVEHPVSWVGGSTVPTDLGTLGGNNATANAVSADGNVIVGHAERADFSTSAVSWVNGSTVATELVTPGGRSSYANAVSADGSVIVGSSGTADNESHAASWVDGSTVATDLGTLGGIVSSAYAVSADGSVIVGNSQDADGNYRAFIYRTQMQDLSNLALSFPTMANDTQIAVAELEYSAGRLMGTTCLADAGSACLRVDGSLSNTGATDSDDIEARSNQSLSLTYGRGLNAQTTLGGTLSITPSGSDNNGFDMGRTVGLSLWGAYSESGQLGTGWQASASVGRNTGNADISRGRGLDNVVVSTGSADVTTNSMQATLGYGVQQQDWLFTPSATLTRYNTTRDAYSESGGDFNAAYDSLSVSSTTLDLQLAADYHVSDTGTLMLEAGMVKDINVDAITLTGTSDMPGMTAVSTDGGLERNDTRGFASIGYRHELNDSSSITGALRAGQSAFGNQLQVNVGVGFAMEF